MSQDIQFGIRITADGRVALVETERVKGGLDAIGSSANKTAEATEAAAKRQQRAMRESGDSASALGSSIKAIGGYVAGAFTVGAVVHFTRELVDAQVQADKLRNSLAFSTGSQSKAAEEMAYVRQEAYRLGLELNTTGSSYAKLQASANGTSLAGEKARSIFEAVAKAGMVMGLAAEEQNGALLAIAQMMSKGTVQAEELRGQLGERIPGAFNIAARAMGVTTAQLGKMLEQGEVLASDFLPKFAAELEKSLGDAPTRAANSTQAALNRMSTAWTDAKQSFNDTGALSPAVALMERATVSMKGFADGVRDARKHGWNGVGQFFAGVGASMYGALGGETDPEKAKAERIAELRRRIESGQYQRDDAPGFKTGDSKGDLEAELERLIRGGRFKLPDLKGEAEKTQSDLQAMFAELYGRWETQLAKTMPSSAARKAIKDYEKEFAVLQQSNPQAYEDGMKPLRKKLADAVKAETAESRQTRLAQIDGELKESEQRWKAWSDEVSSLNKRALVGDEQALSARQVAEQKILEAKLSAAKARVALAVDPSERAKAVKEVELLQQEMTAAQARAADEREALAKAEGDAIMAARLDAAKREGKALEAAGLQFTKEYQDKVLKAALDGNDELLAAYAAIGQEALRQGAFDEAKARYEELFAQMKAEMDSVRQAAEQDGGLLAAIGAGQQADEIKNKFVPALREARQEMERMAGTSPVNGKAVAEAGRQIQEVSNQMSPFWKNFWDDMNRGLTDHLMRSAESDGRSFGQRFVSGLQAYFKTAVLKLSVQLVADGITGMAKSALGFGGGSGGSFNLSSLFSPDALQSSGASFMGDLGAKLGFSDEGILSMAQLGQYLPYLPGVMSILNGDIGSGLGSMAGFALGGPIGAIAGSFLGGMLDGNDGPAERTATARQWGSDEYGYKSAIGGFAPWANNQWFSADMAPAQDAFAKTVVSLDNRIAKAVTEADMTAIRAKLAADTPDSVGFGTEHTDVTQSGAFDKIWRERYGLILDALLPGMGKLSTEATLTADQIIGLVGTISQIRDGLATAGLDTVLAKIAATAPEAAASMLTLFQYAIADPIADATKQAEVANRSLYATWQNQGVALRQLIAGYDNSAASAQALATAAQTRYQTELALAAQMQQAVASATAMFHDGARAIDLSILDNAGKYDYLDKEAKGYRDMIAAATDPKQIEEYSRKLSENMSQAWSLLTPEGQKAHAQEFKDRYAEAEALVKSREQALSESLANEHQVLQTRIAELSGVVDSLTDAAEALRLAAEATRAAVSTPQTVRFEVPGMGTPVEVGAWSAA